MEKGQFTKGVERLINPIDVGTLHFIQSFNNYIPKKIMKKMVDASGKVTPYMGFVVEPYSYFLCYEIEDLESASKLLPDGFELMKTKVFEDDEPKYYSIFGCFNAHTSGFWGMRVECYLIAKDTHTGLLSWVIVDYDTNTITYDPKSGLRDANAKDSLITVDYNGMLYCEITNTDGRQLVFNSDITQGEMKSLDQRLWIEGNLSVAYGGNKTDDDPGVFSLTFDPGEFQQALKLPLDSLTLVANNWVEGIIKKQPSQVLCFPYAQHFLADSPGHSSRLRDEGELVKAVDSADFSKINVFSTKSFKTSFLVGGAISVLSNLIWMILYFSK